MSQNDRSSSAAVRLGAAIRRVREAQGLRQADLAGRLECSQQYVSKIEQAKVGVTTRCVCRVARALGVPPKAVYEEARQKSQIQPLGSTTNRAGP